MILTGHEIKKAAMVGDITISPFNEKQINPNSYNYRLGGELLKSVETENGVIFKPITIPGDGIVLEAQTLYLGHTEEKIGSTKYAMSLIGRSSMGRLGLFLQTSANLGHTGSCHSWTLEIFACQPIKVYPNMVIGQVSFWQNAGVTKKFEMRYAMFNRPTPSFAQGLVNF